VEKVSLANEYRSMGLRLGTCLEILSLTRNQFYYEPTGKKPGKATTKQTFFIDPKTKKGEMKDNEEVVNEIVKIKQDHDQADYYKLICVALCLKGYFINHKKVFRLMQEQGLLLEKVKSTGKTYVKYKRAAPNKPLEILEMDIKYIWVSGRRKYVYNPEIIDPPIQK
jgi:putative transposase